MVLRGTNSGSMASLEEPFEAPFIFKSEGTEFTLFEGINLQMTYLSLPLHIKQGQEKASLK